MRSQPQQRTIEHTFTIEGVRPGTTWGGFPQHVIYGTLSTSSGKRDFSQTLGIRDSWGLDFNGYGVVKGASHVYTRSELDTNPPDSLLEDALKDKLWEVARVWPTRKFQGY